MAFFGAVAVTCWLALIEILVAAGWAARLPPLFAYAPLFAALLVMTVIHRPLALSGANMHGRVLGIASGVVIASIVLASATLDFSYDGQDYHADAVYALVQGWNPFAVHHSPGPNTLWVSHYAKGPWIIGATLARLFGNYEIAKFQNLVLAVTASMLVYHVARLRRFSVRASWLIATLVALNPVNSYQLATGFVDSQVGSLIIILALFLYCMVVSRHPAARMATFCVIVLLVNSKFSALLPTGVLIGAFLAYLIWRRDQVQFFKLAALGGAGLIAGLFVGFNPYFTNSVDHGNPFFPLAGSGSVNIIKGFVADEFLTLPRITKFFLSQVSESHHQFGRVLESPAQQIRWKLPFAVSGAELKTFYMTTGPIIGGFGFWMSGILLLLMSLSVASLAALRGVERQDGDTAAKVLLAGLLVSVLAFPEAWWARYVPQFWGFVVLSAAFLMQSTRSRFKFLGMLVFLAIIINATVIFGAAMAHQLVQERDYRFQIASLKRIGAQEPVELKVKFESSAVRLRTFGVLFRRSDHLACAREATLIGGGGEICMREAMWPQYSPGAPNLRSLFGG